MAVDILQRNRDEQISICKRLISEIPDNAAMLNNLEQLNLKKFLQTEIRRTEWGLFDARLGDGLVLQDSIMLELWFKSYFTSYVTGSKVHFLRNWINNVIAKQSEKDWKGAINGLYL